MEKTMDNNRIINNEITKKIDFNIKKIKEDKFSTNEIIGIANKYDVVDYHNDITDYKSFENDLKNGKTVPVFLSHNHEKILGVADLENRKDGLWAKIKIYTNTNYGKETYEIAKQMQKDNRPMQLSIGYRILKSEPTEINGQVVRYLKQIEVDEISLVPLGANPQSKIQEIKNIKGEKNMEKVNLKELNDKIIDSNNELEEKKEQLENMELKKNNLSNKELQEQKELLTAIKKLNEEITETQKIRNEYLEKNIKNIENGNSTILQTLRGTEQMEIKTIYNQKDILDTREYKNAWLKNMQRQQLTPQEAKFLQVGTNPTGNEDASPLVPTTIWKNILNEIKLTSNLINEITILEHRGKLDIAYEKDSTAAKFVTEGEEIKGSTGSDSIKFDGHIIATSLEFSETTRFMTIEDFEAFVIRVITNRIKEGIEQSIATGTGTGQPTGILLDTSIKSVKIKELNYDAIIEMIKSLKLGYSNGAKFVMNNETFWTIQNIKDKNDRPIWNHNISSDGVTNKILGYEVVLTDTYPTFSKTNKNNCISFGKLNTYYVNFQEPLTLRYSEHIGIKKLLHTYVGAAILDGKVVEKNAFVNFQPE
ncbi:phage major capsid protein [Spiroplasma citri]|uniref:Phage major capsid protein n=2 Tax=Spiroplasma citri TaxID=2133 RepID=A0AAX3T0D2_SPICI|nr:phage major capsid protein [Spiroplasma citri]